MAWLYLCLVGLVPCLSLASPVFTANTKKINVDLDQVRSLISSRVKDGLHELRSKLAAKNNVSLNEQSSVGLSPGRNFDQLKQENQTTNESQSESEGIPSIPLINSQSSISEGLYQSDIILTDDQIDQMLENMEDGSNSTRQKRQAVNRYIANLWTDGLVYSFASSASISVNLLAQQIQHISDSLMKKAFLLGVDFWESNTCIDFRESNTARDRVELFSGDGCYSFISKVGRKQELSLGHGCETYGVATHELGHALGYFHTQSRHDRDKHIKLNTDNIDPELIDQFDKQSKYTNDNLAEPYDYGGIMHYGASSGSIQEGKFTMVPLKRQYIVTIGTPIPAFYDKKMMNILYDCMELCTKSDHKKCKNGGYAHPRNCAECVCPDGYGGKNCTTRPDGCGNEIQATSEWKLHKISIRKDLSGVSTDDIYMLMPEECIYWFRSPKGTKVQARSYTISTPSSDSAFAYGCMLGFVEFKSRADPAVTGPRICNDAYDPIRTFKSTKNLMIVRSVTTLSYLTAYIEVRYGMLSFSFLQQRTKVSDQA
ncbi:hypothetical protein WR25_06629 isoform I [Diploscapter pachys]|uniref:Zinc metalloproteinase n=1 Tax=Diploscapter pachys TaxID=2018661 RepID=A0A2A2L0X2_9BILA|nr:hypothetical protein WR25_06629 isoform I [Diploscapter pachys]